MSYSDEWDDEAVDRLLSEAVPERTRVTSGIEDELARMSVAAGDAVRATDRPRHVKRAATMGVTFAVLFGGASVATAATLSGWSPWAENPDGKYFYTAPTGESCEVRVGNIVASDPQLESLIKDAQGWGVVLDDDAIAANFQDEHRVHDQYEAEQRALGNEPVIQPDSVLYEIAIHRTIQDYVDEQLAANGYSPSDSTDDVSQGLSGEIRCEAPGE